MEVLSDLNSSDEAVRPINYFLMASCANATQNKSKLAAANNINNNESLTKSNQQLTVTLFLKDVIIL